MQPEELRKQLKKGAFVGVFFAAALLFYVLGWTGALVAYALAVSVLAVLAILLQSGRGGGLATSLGGLGGDSLLGTHSATPIAKATGVMLALILFICILHARLGASGAGEASLLPQEPPLEFPMADVGGPEAGAPAGVPAAEAPALPAAEGATREPEEAAEP